VASVPTIFPARARKCMWCPRLVKVREEPDLDKTAGTTYSSGYAIREDGMVAVGADHCASPIEGGTVQNMPCEARGLFMERDVSQRRGLRGPDYIAETTGRPNTLGTQPQDNCMLLRSSRHACSTLVWICHDRSPASCSNPGK